MHKDNGLFQNYVLPLLLTLLLIVGSLLLDVINLSNIALTALLFAVIGLAVFFAELMIVRASRSLERNNTYSFVSTLLLTNRSTEGSNMLTLDEVVAIEAAADEVWIYAYDLGWEGENSELPDLVAENLKRGVKYRYVIPNNKQVFVRVNSLLNKYKKIKNYKELIKFRSRPRELKLLQFGVAVYNPAVGRGGTRSLSESVVVFYPHYSTFGPNANARFMAIRGLETTEVQEGFLELWDDAKDVEAAEKALI
jgi:hypothetical protein